MCAEGEIATDKTCYCGTDIAEEGEKCTAAAFTAKVVPLCTKENNVCDIVDSNCVVAFKCMCGVIEAGVEHICDAAGKKLVIDSKCVVGESSGCATNLICDSTNVCKIDYNNTCAVGEGDKCARGLVCQNSAAN